MSDEANHLAAILAQPDRDLPRLVYADFLQDTAGMVPCGNCVGRNGEPYWGRRQDCQQCHGTGEVSNGHAERAEFIRVQVELASLNCEYVPEYLPCNQRHGPSADWCKPCQRQPALCRRERELLDANYSAWIEPAVLSRRVPGHAMPPGMARSRSRYEYLPFFRRGFVESITCSWSDWRTHADAIRRATPLREVTFTSEPPNYGACGACEDCCGRLPKFCDRERERMGLPAGITFYLSQHAAYRQESFAQLFPTVS